MILDSFHKKPSLRARTCPRPPTIRYLSHHESSNPRSVLYSEHQYRNCVSQPLLPKVMQNDTLMSLLYHPATRYLQRDIARKDNTVPSTRPPAIMPTPIPCRKCIKALKGSYSQPSVHRDHDQYLRPSSNRVGYRRGVCEKERKTLVGRRVKDQENIRFETNQVMGMGMVT